MDNILASVKKIIGVAPNHNTFDDDLMLHINTIFTVLTQLGIGPSDGFILSDKNQTWSEFISPEFKEFNSVKTYMGLRVKLLFDPPLSSVVTDAVNRSISELEWRLIVAAETEKTTE